MRRIAATLGVSRSQLHARLQVDAKPRRRYHKAQDAALLPVIRRLVDTRPTYGYRRNHGTAETRACQGRPAPRQPQARVSDHATERPAAHTPQRSASRPAP